MRLAPRSTCAIAKVVEASAAISPTTSATLPPPAVAFWPCRNAVRKMSPAGQGPRERRAPENGGCRRRSGSGGGRPWRAAPSRFGAGSRRRRRPRARRSPGPMWRCSWLLLLYWHAQGQGVGDHVDHQLGGGVGGVAVALDGLWLVAADLDVAGAELLQLRVAAAPARQHAGGQ